MNVFGDILAQLEARRVDAPSPRPAPKPVAPGAIEWTLDSLERRSDHGADPTRGIWPRSEARARLNPDDCPHCGGVGSVFKTTDASPYQVAVDCVCADLRKLVTAYNRIGLPPGFDHVTVEGTDWQWPTARAVREPVMGLIEGWTPGARGLVMYGTNGSGKNHMAALICTMIATRRPADYGDGRGTRRPIVRAVAWPTLVQKIKAGFNSKMGEAEITAPYVSADVLWLDEIGMGRETDWTSAVVEELLWRRLNSEQTTIITTNLAPHERAAYPGWTPHIGTMAETLNPRVMSRMQSLTFVQMAGADYRSKKGRQG